MENCQIRKRIDLLRSISRLIGETYVGVNHKSRRTVKTFSGGQVPIEDKTVILRIENQPVCIYPFVEYAKLNTGRQHIFRLVRIGNLVGARCQKARSVDHIGRISIYKRTSKSEAVRSTHIKGNTEGIDACCQ